MEEIPTKEEQQQLQQEEKEEKEYQLRPLTHKEQEEIQQKYFLKIKQNIRGLINKLTKQNIQIILHELFQLNLSIGKGLLIHFILLSQTQNPKQTNLLTTLIAVINCIIPEIGLTLLHRIVFQYKLSIERNEFERSLILLQFLSQLINYEVCNSSFCFELLNELKQNETEENVLRMIHLMKFNGKLLQTKDKAKVQQFFEYVNRLKMRRGTSLKLQNEISFLWTERQKGFPNYPIIEEELDLINDEDKNCHEISLTMKLETHDDWNSFHFLDNFNQLQEEWKEMKTIFDNSEDNNQIIDNETNQMNHLNQIDEMKQNDNELFDDQTGANEIFLRKKIVNILQSSLRSDECLHKLYCLQLKQNEEQIVVKTIIERCSNQTTFTDYYSFLVEQMCKSNRKYLELFSTELELEYLSTNTNKSR